MSDTRERCVECGHFICPDESGRAVPAPSPPAPGEVEKQLLAKAQHFDGWDGDPETAALLREAATALASAHRRAEEAEKALDSIEAYFSNDSSPLGAVRSLAAVRTIARRVRLNKGKQP